MENKHISTKWTRIEYLLKLPIERKQKKADPKNVAVAVDDNDNDDDVIVVASRSSDNRANQ